MIPNRKIVVAGVGGAGCRMIDVIYSGMEDGPALVSVNTDIKSLADGRATTKIQIGADLTRGLGAGGDPDTGRKAARDDVEMLRGLFTDTAVVIVIAGLGGGTGSGAAPVVIETAKKAGALVLAFVTLPFDFEGRRKIKIADSALNDIRLAADSTFVIPNERLFMFVNRDNLVDAFQGADDVLKKGISAAWRMLTMPAFIRIDLADLHKVTNSTGGTATFAFGDGFGESRAAVAAESLLASPMLNSGKLLEKTGSVLVSITGSPDLTLSEVGQIMDRISAAVSDQSDIKVGTVIDEDLADAVQIAVFLAEDWGERERPLQEGIEKTPAKSGRKSKTAPKQIQIEFIPGKGRFKDVEPTIMNGEDLDVPSFVRRGVLIESL